MQFKIINNELHQYSKIIDKLEVRSGVDLHNIINTEIMGNFKEVKQAIVSLQTTLGAFTGGAVAGALAGFGAFGGAGLLATASTGTAISALSGVAATNATLAWFGGGSLAAGGLGMAGGTLVLGGIVVAPVLAVAAAVFASNAEDKKYDAYAYYDSTKALCEAMEGEALVYKEICNKTIEKTHALDELREDFKDWIADVEHIISRSGLSVSEWNSADKSSLTKMTQIAKVIVDTINAPIMNDKDSLTRELMSHQKKCKELIDEIQRKWG